MRITYQLFPYIVTPYFTTELLLSNLLITLRNVLFLYRKNRSLE